MISPAPSRTCSAINTPATPAAAPTPTAAVPADLGTGNPTRTTGFLLCLLLRICTWLGGDRHKHLLAFLRPCRNCNQIKAAVWVLQSYGSTRLSLSHLHGRRSALRYNRCFRSPPAMWRTDVTFCPRAFVNLFHLGKIVLVVLPPEREPRTLETRHESPFQYFVFLSAVVLIFPSEEHLEL